jgi:hypothetical protein
MNTWVPAVQFSLHISAISYWCDECLCLPSLFLHPYSIGEFVFCRFTTFSNFSSKHCSFLWLQAIWRIHHQIQKNMRFAFPNPQWMWMSLWPFGVCLRQFAIIQLNLTQFFAHKYFSALLEVSFCPYWSVHLNLLREDQNSEMSNLVFKLTP